MTTESCCVQVHLRRTAPGDDTDTGMAGMKAQIMELFTLLAVEADQRGLSVEVDVDYLVSYPVKD